MACSKVQNLSQATLLAMTTDSEIGDFLNKIPLMQWEVLSFNPFNSEVCVKIYKNFNAAKVQSNIDYLRTQLSITTDAAAKLEIQNAILTRLNQINNQPYNLVTVILPPP